MQSWGARRVRGLRVAQWLRHTPRQECLVHAGLFLPRPHRPSLGRGPSPAP